MSKLDALKMLSATAVKSALVYAHVGPCTGQNRRLCAGPSLHQLILFAFEIVLNSADGQDRPSAVGRGHRRPSRLYSCRWNGTGRRRGQRGGGQRGGHGRRWRAAGREAAVLQGAGRQGAPGVLVGPPAGGAGCCTAGSGLGAAEGQALLTRTQPKRICLQFASRTTPSTALAIA